MYHLFLEEERQQVMRHVLSRLAPGGMVYVSFITLHAGLQYYMEHDLQGLISEMEQDQGYVECLAQDRAWQGMAFTHARFDPVREIKRFCGSLGLTQRCLFGQEGNLGALVGRVQALEEPHRSLWIDLADTLCEREDFLNHAQHLLYIGEFPRG